MNHLHSENLLQKVDQNLKYVSFSLEVPPLGIDPVYVSGCKDGRTSRTFTEIAFIIAPTEQNPKQSQKNPSKMGLYVLSRKDLHDVLNEKEKAKSDAVGSPYVFRACQFFLPAISQNPALSFPLTGSDP